MNNIPVIDLIFAILIILMAIHGYAKGFVVEFFAWASLVLSIWVAILLYHQGAAFIRTMIMEDVKYVPEILAFLVIFLIVLMILKMIEHVLKDIVKNAAMLGGANKVLGLFFGLVEGFTFTVLILFVLNVQPVFKDLSFLNDSIFNQILKPLIQIPLNRGKETGAAVFLILPGMRFPRFPV